MIALLGIALLTGLFADAGFAQCRYTIEVIDGPTNCGTFNGHAHASGLDAQGNVVGWFNCGPGNQRAGMWLGNGSQFAPVPFPPGTEESRAYDIANDGTIVGVRNQVAYRYHPQQGFLSLGIPPGGTFSEAFAVNAQSVIVGVWGDVVNGPGLRALRWHNGVLQDLGEQFGVKLSEARDINDAGVITGWMGETTPQFDARAFVWNNGRITNLGLPPFPGCYSTEGRSINNHNHVCGEWWHPTDIYPFRARKGFFWNGHMMIDLGSVPGYNEVRPIFISDSDVIVGKVQDAFTELGEAFIWRNGELMLLDELVDTKLQILVEAGMEMNQFGQIACRANVPGRSVAILLTPVPLVSGDLNCDGGVNVHDLLNLIGVWGPCGPGSCPADLNQDQIVGVEDLLVVLTNWGHANA